MSKRRRFLLGTIFFVTFSIVGFDSHQRSLAFDEASQAGTIVISSDFLKLIIEEHIRLDRQAEEIITILSFRNECWRFLLAPEIVEIRQAAHKTYKQVLELESSMRKETSTGVEYSIPREYVRFLVLDFLLTRLTKRSFETLLMELKKPVEYHI